jgi:SNF2 family DNA or RNA helicase
MGLQWAPLVQTDDSLIEESIEVVINTDVRNFLTKEPLAIEIDEGNREAVVVKGQRMRHVPRISVREYLSLINKIPCSSGYNQRIWLMPHQASVVNSAMHFHPIRALLCDEVGLGKTIQAGAIMSRLKNEGSGKNVLIIAPAATLNQWAIEISEKFDFPVNILRDRKRIRFVEGEWFSEIYAGNPLAFAQKVNPELDEVVVISSQWFRGRSDNEAQRWAKHFDLVILDEAHHARMHNWDKKESTKLWKKMKIVSGITSNLLLLTATPFQTGEDDYIGLLDLVMSLTEEDVSDIRLGTRLVAGQIPWNANQQARLLRSISRRVEMLKNHINTDLFNALEAAEKPLSIPKIMKLSEEHNIDEKLLYSTLPTTLFTFRNTREMLREIGMGFPEVIFETTTVEPGAYTEVIDKASDFITNHLGSKDGGATGFTRSLYHQRMISSMKALRNTLSARIGSIYSSAYKELEFDYAEFLEDAGGMRPADEIEIERVERILVTLDEAEKIEADPKMEALKPLVKKLHQEGRKILIFSRYTSTTDQIEAELLKDDFQELSIGRYDGGCIRIRFAGDSRPRETTKSNLINCLREFKLDVIVCSDAASEGLNLQTASAVINVDVPWNPARVLQRIGRVDRLGQKSTTVVVHNLVYLGTIEERMYRRLDDRQTDAIRMLGEFPHLLQTEESRHLYQPFGCVIEDRVLDEQAEIRYDVFMKRLLQHSEIGNWVDILIEQFPELSLSANPAVTEFAMRNSEILDCMIEGLQGRLGFAVAEDGCKHALLLQMEEEKDWDKFVALTPTLLLQLNSDPNTKMLEKAVTIEAAVDAYARGFGTSALGKRTNGPMAEKFRNRALSEGYTFQLLN